MCKYLILVIITVCSGIYSYAQSNINMIEVLNIERDMVSLENRIMYLIKKNPATANIQGLRQFHILWLGDVENNLKKEDYLDHSFLYKFGYGYYHLGSNSLFKKEKKYIRTTTLITDSTGNLVAIGDARLIHISHIFDPNYVKLAKMFFEKEIDFVFRIGRTFNRYVGIKGNTLYALEATKDGLQTYTWEEFMKCCFDEWVYSSLK